MTTDSYSSAAWQNASEAAAAAGQGAAYQRSLDELHGLFGEIDKLEEDFLVPDRFKSRVHSAAFLDDQVTDPFRLSHAVTYCQTMAMDNLVAFRSLLNPARDGDIRFPLFAHYPLLRSTMESSAQALWLISPPSRAVRVTRLLRASRDELAYNVRMTASATSLEAGDVPVVISRKNQMRRKATQTKRRTAEAIERVARAASLDLESIGDRLPGYGEIVGEGSALAGAGRTSGEATWMWISGLTHPSSSRGLSASTITDTAAPSGRVRTVDLTVDIEQLLVAARLAVALFITAQAHRGRWLSEDTRPGET